MSRIERLEIEPGETDRLREGMQKLRSWADELQHDLRDTTSQLATAHAEIATLRKLLGDLVDAPGFDGGMSAARAYLNQTPSPSDIPVIPSRHD